MAEVVVAGPQPTSFIQQLRESEQHWAWKFGMRVMICIADIIGIGCAAWLVTTSLSFYANPYIGYFDGGMIPGGLGAMGVSFVWCLMTILIHFLRRPPRPAHPGISVGVDLIIWLSLIVTGLFAVAAVYNLASFGSNTNYLADPGYYNGKYSGHYRLAGNGTWVYHITYVDNSCYNYGSKGCHYNYTAGTYTTNVTAASVQRVCTPAFSSCIEQDTYINRLWKMEIVVAAVQWLGVMLHFILFVWACVDTHRRNHTTKVEETQAIADRVIRDMQARGLITVHNTPVNRANAAERVMAQSGPTPTDSEDIGRAR